MINSVGVVSSYRIDFAIFLFFLGIDIYGRVFFMLYLSWPFSLSKGCTLVAAHNCVLALVSVCLYPSTSAGQVSQSIHSAYPQRHHAEGELLARRACR